ncbi:MAG: hypothetical protein QG652_844 [Pseudomonadota bacterium]|nr:hypothetical protein [Pseudomonadota bacterium]
MDKFERIYQLHHFLKARRYPASIQTICENLHCGKASAYRYINELRDELNAPVEQNRDGIRYAENNTFELPGLWFSNEELHALLAAHQYLSLTHPGLIEPHIKPLRQRIEKILRKHHQHPDAALQRIRLLGIGMRHSDQQYFRHIASAVLARKQLHIHYTRRSDGSASERDVSPQRLTHYRDNWYLDAWCHSKNELRTFALDQISQCNTLDAMAREIDNNTLNQHYASAYGIFAGEADKIATLKFNARRARWIEKEQWHPQQTGEWKDNYYLLNIPYNNPTELIMDILKYGTDVEVLAPDELRAAVQLQISGMRAVYWPKNACDQTDN